MTRDTIGADIYYPSDPDALRSSIQAAVAAAEVDSSDAAVVVAPNGGYELSLPYLGAALRACSRVAPEFAVVLAPPPGVAPARIMLPQSDSFATPLGEMPVETTLLERLRAECPEADYDEIAHLSDHSIEVQLPGLRYLYGPIPIVPLLIGELTPEAIARAARCIAAEAGDRTFLTVVSANLSGFANPKTAEIRARETIRLIIDSPGEAVLPKLATMSERPRSTWPLVLGHCLAADARPVVLGRDLFEIDVDSGVGCVVFGSVAYFARNDAHSVA